MITGPLLVFRQVSLRHCKDTCTTLKQAEHAFISLSVTLKDTLIAKNSSVLS